MNLNITPLLLLITGLAFLSMGCKPESSTPARPGEDGTPQSGLPTTIMTIGSKPFTLEIAATHQTREIGLMYRDSMPADHGMIFVFDRERVLPFWMKHTRLPLDIIYVDKGGKVVSIHQMKPFDLTGTTSRGPAQYAIELNQGSAAAAGVKDGDQLHLPADVTSITAQ